MGRRNRCKDSGVDELFAFLTAVPVWVGPLLMLGVFVGLYWGLPWCFAAAETTNAIAKTAYPVIAKVSTGSAPFVAGFVALVWLFAEGRKWADRKRLDKQTDITSVRALSWNDFERLLGEAFRRLYTGPNPSNSVGLSCNGLNPSNSGELQEKPPNGH